MNSVYPNPFRDQLNLAITLPRAEKFTINIFDLSGKLVRTSTAMGVAGLNTIIVKGLSNLASATYVMEVKSNEDVMRVKLYKRM